MLAFLKVPLPRSFSRPAGGARLAAIHMEPVANLRRPSVENTESSYLMGERNAEGQHSDSAEEDDDMHAKSQNGVAAAQKGKNKMVWIP